MTGVVGPNGCGKSNIIDALRWGLGESRASLLRGGALQDVLFNGNGKRPPSDWCAVEIRFAADENDDLGMWRGASEIAVKRELGRDGQSAFYINGRAARRRDIVDLFRGTGVSPRSYAVVEQGMVGAIAEASPDDLRKFLEETAGVAHYKDRRRDAERRLASCRANLEQLGQLLDASRRRQESLKRQARAAQRHSALGDAINDLEVLLILQNRESEREKLAAKEREIATLEERIAGLRAKTESRRAAAEAARAEHEEWQKRARAGDADLVRAQAAAEQVRRDYEHAEQKRAQLQARAAAEQGEQSELDAAAAQCAEDKQRARNELKTAAAELEKCAKDVERAEAELKQLQDAHRATESETETARQKLAEAGRQREGARMRARLTEEQRGAWEERLAELRAALKQTEQRETAPPSAAKAAKTAAAREESHRAAEAACKTLSGEESAALEELRAAEKAQAAGEAERAALQSMEEKHEWKTAAPPRLSAELRAAAGEWARALDSALGRFAAAYTVPSVEEFLRGGLPPSGAGVADMQGAAGAKPAKDKQETESGAANASRANWTSLLSLLQAAPETRPFLAAHLRGVYIAEDLSSARARRRELSADEMIVMQDGAVFMRDAVFAAGEVRGGFDWQRRLSALDDFLAQNAARMQKAQTRADECRKRVAESETARDKAAAALATARAELSEARIAEVQWEERRRNAETRRREILSEIKSAEAAQKLSAREESELDAGGAENACAKAETELAQAQKRGETSARNLENRRAAEQQCILRARELGIQKENIARQSESLTAQERDIARRRKTLAERIAAGREEIAQTAEPALAGNIKKRAAELAKARAAQQKIAEEETARAQQISAANEEREQQLRGLEELREQNTALQVQKREISLTAERLENSLEDYARDEERLAALRARGLGEEELRGEIGAQRAKRERLGAINFAAAGEYAEGETRLQESETQRLDVESAADDLQKTIRRIDDETRGCLRDVYENVNREFGGLFRRLFGGGEAELAMDGNSFLDAQFEIRARPPGKRMFPVRMLSGGEKTATALAFIFALMRRTPPPFCIMDEADATLDDSRTSLFVALLKEMSAHFQCLVVTHNKNTVEAMEHLIGVTQEEKGASKIVSVSREDAVRAAT